MKYFVRASLFLLLSLPFFGFAAEEGKGIINWNSPESLLLQQRLPVSADFWRLIPQLVTQKNQTYCGIASAVTVLNTLKSNQHGDPVYYPYHYITQDSFFTPAVLPYLAPKSVMREGSSIADLQQAIRSHGVQVEAISSDSLTLESFQQFLRQTLNSSEHFVLANYLRTSVQQDGGGHWSILGAYDVDSDRVLIMDVARYRYGPIWVKSSSLLNAINTEDSDGFKRGMLLISR